MRRIVDRKFCHDKLDLIDAILVNYVDAQTEDLPSLTSQMTLSDGQPDSQNQSAETMLSLSKFNWDCSSNSWEMLDENNLESFQILHSGFNDGNTNEEHLKDSLNYFSASFNDYPVEFYLQPPSLFEDLVNLLPKISNSIQVTILRLIRRLTNALKHRLVNLQELSSQSKLICIKMFINALMDLVVVNLREISGQQVLDLKTEEFLVELYRLLADLVDFIQEANEICHINLNELLESLAKAGKSFRMAYCGATSSNKKNRTHYVILNFLLHQYIEVYDAKEIFRSDETNLWEEESDILLIDVPLKVLMPSIYKLIRKNRLEAIKSDEYLETLLNYETKKSWMAVVEICKVSGEYRDEDILFMGNQALETLQIHKSTSLVQILFEKLER